MAAHGRRRFHLMQLGARSGWRARGGARARRRSRTTTAQAARRWTTGASGEEGRRRRSGWGLGAAEIGDDGAVGRHSGMVELRAALGHGGAPGWRSSGLTAQWGGGARSARPLVAGDGGAPGQRRRRAGGGGRRGRRRHERGGDQELTKCWRKAEEWEIYRVGAFCPG